MELKIQRIAIVSFAIIFLSSSYMMNNLHKRWEEHLVQYESGTTLVDVTFGRKGFCGYTEAYGFIDNNIYEKYMNNEDYGKVIKLYHPYVKGKNILIDKKLIVSVSKR